MMALVLAAGPGAAASQRSAAALLGIPGFDRTGRPEVTTPRPRRHRNPEGLVHRSGGTTRDLAAKGRTGIALMRQLLEARGAGYVAPESELESRFVALIQAAGLPRPLAQFDGGDLLDWVGRVDFAYPAQKVVIELDSRRHHSAMLDADSDRRRDNRLTAAGWRVVRLTWSDVAERPTAVVGLIRQLLGLAAA